MEKYLNLFRLIHLKDPMKYLRVNYFNLQKLLKFHTLLLLSRYQLILVLVRS